MGHNNPATQKIYDKKRKSEYNTKIREIKSKAVCADCGKNYHFSAMDFDHTENDKSFGVAMFGGFAWKKIQAEIDKCEIVCANCHRIRTFNRRNGPSV